MAESNILNVVAVLPVKEQKKAVDWYTKLLGRKPDVVPVDEVAEWMLAENAWIQVTVDPEQAGNATVIVGVADIETQKSVCAKAKVPLGEVVEIPGVIKMAEAADPAGNKVTFVEDISGAA